MFSKNAFEAGSDLGVAIQTLVKHVIHVSKGGFPKVFVVANKGCVRSVVSYSHEQLLLIAVIRLPLRAVSFRPGENLVRWPKVPIFR